MIRRIVTCLAIGLFATLSPLVARAQTNVQVTGQVPSVVNGTLSTVVANLVELPADGTSLVIITVTLADKDGNLVAGKDVQLSSNRGSVDIVGAYDGNNLTESSTGTSSSSGIVRFAARSYAAGQATFSTYADNYLTLDEKPTVTFTPLPVLSNLSVTVTLPGGTTLTLLQPKAPTTEKSDLANKSLVNNQLNLRIPFWAFLVVVIILLLDPILLFLVLYLIRRTKKSFQLQGAYHAKEQEMLGKIDQLEQQIASGQQSTYQQGQQLGTKLEMAKTELKETINQEVELAVEKTAQNIAATEPPPAPPPIQPTNPPANPNP
ncbi:MAG TPA: invasin domain 3-containing protein [Candidatus Saccharimonadales bacterium]|nr:invasin domain 3-containing protein [Candidatus Saccharimonadales bacterium]